MKKEKREIELLTAVWQLLNKQNESLSILNLLEETVNYDGVECDGSCLMEDIEDFLREYSQLSSINENKEAKLIERAKELEREIPSNESIEISVNEETNMIEIRRYNESISCSYKIEDFCHKDEIDKNLADKLLSKTNFYIVW